MNDIKPQVNNLFLIGAGFTRAVFPEAPLNNGLLPILCKGSASATLTRLYREHKTTDIEVLLTYLDLNILRPKRKKQIALQKVRKEIERKLAEYFEQFRFGKGKHCTKDWLKPFAQEVFQQNDVIVLLNYDCFLEGLLNQHEVWCPSTGYGAVEVDVPGTSFYNQINPKNILIYKIHGSENFQTTSLDSEGVDIRRISLVVNNGEIYPKTGKFSKLGIVEGRSYIIAPSFVKTWYPQIELMFVEAVNAASFASNFVIIGCSLRPEDNHLWLLLTKFMNQSISSRKLIIVDPYAEDIKSKICDHYFVDINRFINIKLCPSGLECAFEQLINELNENNAQ